MADANTLDKIRAEQVRRTLALSDQADHIQVILSDLADSWAREAELLVTSKRKGWQSERKEILSAATLLRAEVIAIGKLAKANTPPREPVTGPTPSWTNHEGLNALVQDSQDQGRGKLIAGDKRCAAQDTDHGKHTWVGPRDEATGSDRWNCWGGDSASDVAAYLAGDTHSLTLTELSVNHYPSLFPINTAPRVVPTFDLSPLPEFPAGTPEYDEYAIELRTELEKFAGGKEPYPYTEQVLAVERLGTHLYRESSVHHTIDEELPEVHADPITPAVPMFREADAPTARSRPVPPSMASVKPYTWADLAQPAVPMLIPDHLSPSQLEGLDKCPAQMRIGRYEGNPGVPLWGAVGGTAFHRAVEELERGIWGPTNPGTVWPLDLPEIEALWNKHFQATVAENLASGVPMLDWHASNRGKENYSWWLVEGGEMLKRYVTWRVKNDDGRRILVLPDGRPAIELELLTDVENSETVGHLSTLPIKVILDIVFILPDGTLEIWDHKTRQDFMGPIVDTIQLGTQGHALFNELATTGMGVNPLIAITARYFDARKGEPTPAFDPLDKHPIEELEMRYADADDKRRNRPAIPVRSNLCKACPVAYLCPVGSKL